MRHLFVFASLAALAGCVAPSAPPPAPARPMPVPAPAPTFTPPPPAASSDWRDWPVTPGDWVYRREGQGSSATYGAAGSQVFSIRCDAAGGRLSFVRSGAAGPMTVRTSSTARTVSGALLASDQLVDAIGYSRGRFIVESASLPPLVIPAWPEVLRVAEDCRR